MGKPSFMAQGICKAGWLVTSNGNVFAIFSVARCMRARAARLLVAGEVLSEALSASGGYRPPQAPYRIRPAIDGRGFAPWRNIVLRRSGSCIRRAAWWPWLDQAARLRGAARQHALAPCWSALRIPI